MNTCSTLVEVPACRQDSNFGLTPLKGSDISWVQLVRRILNRTTLFQGRSFCVYWIISGCQSVSSINLAPPTQYVSKSLTSLSLCPSVSDEYWVLIISTVPKLSGNDFQKFDGKLPIIDHRCLKWVFRALAIYPVQVGLQITQLVSKPSDDLGKLGDQIHHDIIPRSPTRVWLLYLTIPMALMFAGHYRTCQALATYMAMLAFILGPLYIASSCRGLRSELLVFIWEYLHAIVIKYRLEHHMLNSFLKGLNASALRSQFLRVIIDVTL
ncbi:hypothetical protein Tco_0538299 [Tanacetum coccineum]